MDKETPTTKSISVVETPFASKYLQQLSKHFQHKTAVTYDKTHAHIDLKTGTCELDANENELNITVSVTEAAEVAHLQDVVERHLIRFAFREDVKFTWHTA